MRGKYTVPLLSRRRDTRLNSALISLVTTGVKPQCAISERDFSMRRDDYDSYQ
jgi:hypothetical protein